MLLHVAVASLMRLGLLIDRLLVGVGVVCEEQMDALMEAKPR